jgi:hypothetical protein
MQPMHTRYVTFRVDRVYRVDMLLARVALIGTTSIRLWQEPAPARPTWSSSPHSPAEAVAASATSDLLPVAEGV